MKLLEFYPRGYRHLRDTLVVFTDGSEREPAAGCSIRFLVGRNGTGKTTLLRFLAAIFAAFDADYRQPSADNPAYSVPFELLYLLRGNVVTVVSEGRGRAGLTVSVRPESVGEGEQGDQLYQNGELPSKDALLPATVLISTSGDLQAWRSVLTSATEQREDEEPQQLPTELLLDDELPPGQPPSNEQAQPATWILGESRLGVDTQLGSSNKRVVLVEPPHLPLALLTACLGQYAEDEREQQEGANFNDVLHQVGVQRLISFSLRLRIVADELTAAQRRLLRRLYDQATLTLRQFNNEQLWVFDVDARGDDQPRPTRLILGAEEQQPVQPFQLFQALVGLHQDSILQQANLIILKGDADDDQDQARVLLAASLSDGERAFLERMALVHLLREEECLFLLDEPETHFNDYWKRTLVSQIEQTLVNTQSEVVLITHASITLTDAYPHEVILLGPHGQQSVPLTLAAEPGELLRSVFGAPNSIGERATRAVNTVLADDASPQQLLDLFNQVGIGDSRWQVAQKLGRRVDDAIQQGSDPELIALSEQIDSGPWHSKLIEELRRRNVPPS